MLKTAITNIKRSCSVVLVPKILLWELKALQRSPKKRTYEELSKLKKSTNSGVDEEYEKKIRIIEKCFAPKGLPIENKEESDDIENQLGPIITPKYATETKCEKCQRIIAKVFDGPENNINVTNDIEIKSNIALDDVRVQSTTLKEAEVKLTQNVDMETDISKVEGFNIPPKILSKDVPSYEQRGEPINIDKKLKGIVTPKFATDATYEKGQGILAKAFKYVENNINVTKDVGMKSAVTLEDAKIQSITSKQAEEKLAQKIDSIDEISVVEADSKIEGFNVPPKILSHEFNTLKFSRKQGKGVCQIDYDKIAKQCLGVPINEIDDRLLSELRKLSQKPSVPSTAINDVTLRSNIASKYCEENYFGDVLFKNNNTQSQKSAENFNDVVYPPYNLNFKKQYNINTNYNINVPSSDNNVVRNYCEENYFGDVLYKTNEMKLLDNKTKDLKSMNNTLKESNLPSTSDFNKQNDSHMLSFNNNDIKLEIRIDEDGSLNKKLTNEIVINQQATENIVYNSAEIKGAEIEPNIKCFGIHKGIVYTKTENTCDANPLQHSKQQQEEENVIQNTAISGTFPTPPPYNLGRQHDTAISANQELNEFSLMSLSGAVFNSTEIIEPLVLESPVVQNVFYSPLNTSQSSDENDVTYQYVHPISQIIFETELKRIEEIPSVVQSKHVIDSPIATHAENLSAAPKLSEEIPKITESAQKMSEATPIIREDTPLSEMLRIVRERNRLEAGRDYVVKASEDIAMKKSPCIPPLETSGKPNPTLGPAPCRPKPKETKKCPDPCGAPKKDPCAPKKDPCAKFSTYLGAILQNVFITCSNFRLNLTYYIPTYVLRRNISTQAMLTRFGDVQINKFIVLEQNVYAREFEPWTPIPSWPTPKGEKKKPFVCPKEGCKMIPPPNFHGPCDKNPCRSFPSFPRRRFSTNFFHSLYWSR